VDGQCVTPTSETCDYLACVTFEWDLEYLSWLDYQSNKTTWIPSTGTATIRCASESRQLITVSLSSCFGSGATAEVTAPVGYERADMGPISAVAYSPGSGYAKLGREAPTLTVSGGTGAGLTVTPTATATNDSCGIPTWSITAVTFSGGTGYENGEALTVTTKAGDTTKAAAVLTVQTAPRSQPTLTASVSGGTGATLTPTLASNGGSPQTWGVASVSVSGTTSGYTDGASVTFSYGAGVTEQAAAVATIKTARATPTITASVAGGSGASLTVTLSQSPTTPSDTALWHVDSVTVANGGTGYTDGDPVTFTVTDGTEVVAASGTIQTARENPNLTPYVWGSNGTTAGVGASLSATMAVSGDYWTVTGITINNGGSGYEVGEYIWYSELDPSVDSSPPYYVEQLGGYWITSVDGSGAITGIALDSDNYPDGGLYYKQSDVIQSVTITEDGDYYKATTSIARVVVTNGGQYYYYTGIPTGVTVTSGGAYYREDASLPPYVADVTVTINQLMPSEGTGAELSAVIDTDTGSATFGQVTVSIADGGDGYLAQRTVHPDALLLMCFDSNDEQDENLAPNFPATGDQLEWLMPAGGSEPGITLGFPLAVNPCCTRSFVAFPDAGFTLADDPYTAITIRNGTYFELEDEDDVVVIRGTVTETLAPVWFAEDCDCANPLP
jgi:hypothetical protein